MGKGGIFLVFSSLTFLLIFLPAVMLIYCLSPVQTRNLILALVSLVFYAWGEPKCVLIMIFSTIFDYFNGRGIEKCQLAGKSGKGFLVLSVIGNLAILGFFKYTDFFINSVDRIFSADIQLLGIALPIGISFYTFQTMSYTIDVYRKLTVTQHNFIDFAAYVTMFPQLIAGPIVRYQSIGEQLAANRDKSTCNRGFAQLTSEEFGLGMQRFIIGLGKKVLLANQAGALWTQISSMESSSVTLAWIGAVCYTFQIYFDFSGYSDMAIGLGHMLGFRFPENFNYPYQCSSITDFWRRWHMTLGTWFREYVYIPLGGNQKGMIRQLRNILIVWALTGLWHGAAWTFVCWGLYYGFILVLEKTFLLGLLDKLPGWIRHIYTLPVIIIGWVIFSAADFSAMWHYLGSMFCLTGNTVLGADAVFYLQSIGPFLLLLCVASTSLPAKAASWITGRHPYVLTTILTHVYLLAVFVLSLAFLVSDSYNPFLYFRF